MLNPRKNVERKVWKKRMCERIWEVGREAWNDRFKNTEKGKIICEDERM